MPICLFTGLLICVCGAEIINTPINNSVIFIKKADIVLTNDNWKVVVHFKLTPFERAIEILLADMEDVEVVTHRTSLIDEVLQAQTAVNSLESKLINLKRFLPKPERRRGLLNVGGSILKLIFGTATVAD